MASTRLANVVFERLRVIIVDCHSRQKRQADEIAKAEILVLETSR